MYVNYNANPKLRRSDDCVIRALSVVLHKTWDEVYSKLCELGRREYDMPSANHIWGKYLLSLGYVRHIAPEFITVEKFSKEHPKGRYILALQGHVVALIDGNFYDTWDSSEEIVLYYWKEA